MGSLRTLPEQFTARCPWHGVVAFRHRPVARWYFCEYVPCFSVVTEAMLLDHPDGDIEVISMGQAILRHAALDPTVTYTIRYAGGLADS